MSSAVSLQDRPTAGLVSEHDHILLLLRVLDALAVQADTGSASADDLSQALVFMREFADGLHHSKEEELLFPLLEKHGLSRQSGPLAVMLHEHEEGRAAADDLAAAIEAMQAARPTGAEDVARAARAYVAVLSEHIDKENMVLFPMAEDLLPLEEKQLLAKALTHVDREQEENRERLLIVLGRLSRELLS